MYKMYVEKLEIGFILFKSPFLLDPDPRNPTTDLDTGEPNQCGSGSETLGEDEGVGVSCKNGQFPPVLRIHDILGWIRIRGSGSADPCL
jgi:hypothetical protein